MKSFIASLVIITICFSTATVNCIWTHSSIEALVQEAHGLTQDNIKRFEDRWRSAERILSYTSRQTFIRDIEDALQRLNAALTEGDEYEYKSAKEALIYKMNELCRYHCFDFKSIL